MGASIHSNSAIASPERDRAKPASARDVTPSRRVLFAPELFRAEGGIARVSRHYLQALADEPNTTRDLHLVVLNDAEIPPAALTRYHAGHAQAYGAGRSKWRCWQALRRAVNGAKNCHVVCTHVHLTPLLWLLSLTRHHLHFDVVLHGIEVWQPLSRPQRKALARADRLICVSDFTRREVARLNPALAPKLVVLPNALDPGFPIVDTSKSTVPYSILTVSRLAAHDQGKGIDHLILAMESVVAALPQAQLRIVGRGVDRERLEGLAQKSAAHDHIHFLGFVEEGELKRELATCALFALPSCKEGFGLVYLEAMAAGKPCIAAQSGGAPEVIDDQSGETVPYGDISALADAIINALTRIWSGEAIRSRARFFSFLRFSERWAQLNTCAIPDSIN